MQLIDSVLVFFKDLVRSVMRHLAKLLNSLSGGRLSPQTVTVTGMLAHVPIAWLISGGNYSLLAGLLLAVFALFDSLDGELARLQGSASPQGMFLDSVTDRLKEITIYCGTVAFLLDYGREISVVIAVAALGVSLATTYINAWGEVVMATLPDKPQHEINKTFRAGIGGFEMRMFVFVVGLVAGRLEIAVYVLLALASLTFIQRIRNAFARL